MQHPFKNCYWVEEGKFLAGEYPRNKDEVSSQAKIDTLLGAGVTAFIDLTEEGELLPYQSFIGSAAYYRFPIVDVSVPQSSTDMIRILDTLDRLMAGGAVIYLHCWGGVGRTGTVVGCWLARHLGSDQGWNRLQAVWKQCAKSAFRSSPETPVQRRYIETWPMGQ
jgi:protein-tyrosine phosphatase